MIEEKFSKDLKKIFLSEVSGLDFASLRFVRERSEGLCVRLDVVQPAQSCENRGVMINVIHKNGSGYGATCDLSHDGIKKAISLARQWAEINRSYSLFDYAGFEMPHPIGEYRSVVRTSWESMSLKDKLDLLKRVCAKLAVSDRIVDRMAVLCYEEKDSYYITTGGGEVTQNSRYLFPDIVATANRGAETQRRSFGGMFAFSRQGGLENLLETGYEEASERIAGEALELLDAPDCPTGKMDVLLDSGQMVLQIHESIGHPLEIDRILGDERNYAGTTFVTSDMFGTYQYGSPLLNVEFDPDVRNELASYRYDDDGTLAKKEFLIEKGILKRGLGGYISQKRSGIPGVANSRASGWDRPPIDRIANLNLVPGASSFEEMVRSVDRGVYMESNTSWSIDDSRNKFQFGCERGQLIENGRLTGVVKKPNYRGISANFWRSLKMVGNRDTFQVLGTPGCGKGEPNQMVCVGHAVPVCLFSDVEVFGGE